MVDSASNPFPGPRPYRAEDRPYFYGREAVAAELVCTILANRSVALFGPSGAGKSSLMQAAVMPALDDNHDFRLVAIDGWPADTRPLEWLLEVVYDQLRLEEPEGLLHGHGPLHALKWMLQQTFLQSDRPLLLYLDQLEQLLYIHRDRAQTDELLHWLEHLAQRPIRGVHLVVGLREDYLGRFRDRARDCHELLEHGFRLGPMTVDEAAQAVCKAAGHGKPPQTWSSEQMKNVMLDVRVPGESHSGRAEVQTAFAQIVCRALFAQRSTTDAQQWANEIHTASILQTYLDNALEGLGPQRDVAERLLEDWLVAADGTRALLTEEGARAAGLASAADMLHILRELERAAILRAEQHRGTRYFELGHDWLALRVHARRQERAAKAEHEAREREREAREQAAAAELAKARAETRKNRRRVFVLACFTVITAGLGLLAWDQRQAAIASQAEYRIARDQAHVYLNQAADVTRYLLIEVLPEYEEVPGTAHLQRELHERLTVLLDTLQREQTDDRDWQRLRVEQQYRRGVLTFEHEDFERARTKFAEALSGAEKLSAAQPDELRSQSLLIRILGSLANVERMSGNHKRAGEHLNRAYQLAQALEQAHPRARETRECLMLTLEYKGRLAKESNTEEARRHYQRAIEIGETAVADDPLPATRVSLCRLRAQLGRASATADRAAIFATSLAKVRALIREQPNLMSANICLADGLLSLGTLERQAGQFTQAREHLGEAKILYEQLVVSDPTRVHHQIQLMDVLRHLAGVATSSGTLERARGYLDRAVGIGESLRVTHPTRLGSVYTAVLTDQLELEYAAGNYAKARAVGLLMLAVVEENPDRDTEFTNRAQHSKVLQQLSYVEAGANDLMRARSYSDQSLELLEQLAREHPNEPELQDSLSLSLYHRALLELHDGHAAEGRPYIDRFGELLAARSDALVETERQRNRGAYLLVLGQIEVAQTNYLAAKTAFESALAELRAISEADPGNDLAKFDVVEVHLALLDLARKQRQRSQRLRHAQAAYTLLKPLQARGLVEGIAVRRDMWKQVRNELAQQESQ